jgi:hypothetical protein
MTVKVYGFDRSQVPDATVHDNFTMEFVRQSDYAALLKERDELNQQVVSLAVESSTIKTMNDCLAEELRGYESDGAFEGPNMHKLWYSYAGALPSTDAAIAELKAQGVEKFVAKCREKAKCAVSSDIRDRWWLAGEHADDFSMQLRKESGNEQ